MGIELREIKKNTANPTTANSKYRIYFGPEDMMDLSLYYRAGDPWLRRRLTIRRMMLPAAEARIADGRR
jgi:hypothetical protein